MEKPGIEPATPGLQGIALNHYTTEASKSFLWETSIQLKDLRVSKVFFKNLQRPGTMGKYI